MKAIVTKKYGDESVLQFSDIPKPNISSNQILIKVNSCSVNPVDWKIRSGQILIKTGFKPPQVLGSDFAGTVVEIGSRIKAYHLHDKVWGKVDSFKGGAYAEFIKVSPENITLAPENICFQQAASIPNVALTAYQALYKQAKLKKGQRVFINGASGGVGIMALQIAKAQECHVTAVCSTKNIDLVKGIGADTVIDYTQDDILKDKSAYDVFFDCVAHLSLLKVISTLNPGGVYVRTIPSIESTLFSPILKLLTRKSSKHIMVQPSHSDLLTLKKLVEMEKLKPVVENVLSVDEVAKAHQLSKSGRVVGKIVLNFTTDNI